MVHDHRHDIVEKGDDGMVDVVTHPAKAFACSACASLQICSTRNTFAFSRMAEVTVLAHES